MVGHFFSPAQDLLVLLTRASPGTREDHNVEVTFKSLSEDKVHPDAASAVVVLEPQVDWNYDHMHAMISGDYYGLFSRHCYTDGVKVDILQIWNWKLKDWCRVKHLDPKDMAMVFCFLSNDRLLVVTLAGLMLYSLVNSANTIQLTAKFSLPALSSRSGSITSIYSVCNQDEASPFTSSLYSSRFQARNQLIILQMATSGDKYYSQSFRCYIEQNAFLELESTYANLYGNASEDTPRLPWSSWGPKCTRFMKGSGYNHCFYGLRTAELIGSAPSSASERDQLRKLCIRDFNPHQVMHYKAGNRTKWRERLVEGELPGLQSHFLEPIGGLPYLEITTREKFHVRDIDMDESRVILSNVYEGDTDVITGIQVLDFSQFWSTGSIL
ncbi:hypothetical protein AZE42_02191 [Rhizopogon vesiculosus]|uniref:Uncharacterized protein n=1 Tax=Rhizopogon vesiculosus TaxID=180088 RepID=A0A1J8QJW7_9AGAM|nr:hypothetical protein AZE42_02191 [Rhizopogon vesiculosus]